MKDTCKRCESKGVTTEAVLTAYWGPALCRPCAQAVAALLDQHDKWPEVPWDDEKEVLTDG